MEATRKSYFLRCGFVSMDKLLKWKKKLLMFNVYFQCARDCAKSVISFTPLQTMR